MKARFHIFLLPFMLLACKGRSVDAHVEIPSENLTESVEIPRDTTLILRNGDQQVEVDLRFPDSSWIGTMIVLQGWNFPRTDWCEQTALCEKALAQGYALVCPEMGKSIYALQVYPETRKDWAPYPTRSWVNETLIPFLEKEHVLSDKRFNCALGLSTGARGAFFLALDHPEVFDAVACLSGDYDQREVPADNLYRGFFGFLAQFPDRWSGAENPMTRLDRLEAAVYLAHGLRDDVVDARHSEILCKALNKKNVECHLVEEAAHDYTFWNAQVDPVLDFFLKTARANNK